MTAEPTTDGSYRDRIVAVEPGGNEYIAEEDRHGKPSQLFWTWASPNLEFATIFVGVLAVTYYGMTFWQAVLGIVVGTGLGAAAHYVLSARGPLHGVPQMVLGRLPFGFKGNAVPAVLMSVTAGLGWFATNSVSGAFALSTLLHIGPLLALVLIVLLQTGLAFFGHNLVQAFEKWAFPVLAVIFVWTAYDLGNELSDTDSRRKGIVMALCAVITTGLMTAYLDSHFTALLGLGCSASVSADARNSAWSDAD